MKIASLVKILCWSLVAVILTTIMASVIKMNLFPNINNIGYNFWSAEDDDGMYYSGDGKVSMDNINRISIDWISGRINIVRSDSNEIEFSETANRQLSEKEKLAYKIEDGELKIIFAKHERFPVKFDKLDKQLNLYIPKDLDVLDIENVSANISINAIKVGDLCVENVSGDLTATGVMANKLEYETVSGNVDFSGSFNDIEGGGVSAKVTINNAVCPSMVDIESVSGNVTLNIPENDGFTINKSSVASDIHSDFGVSYFNDKAVYKNGGAIFEFNCVSGNITVNRINDFQRNQIGSLQF